jgi:hypothetical protein
MTPEKRTLLAQAQRKLDELSREGAPPSFYEQLDAWVAAPLWLTEAVDELETLASTLERIADEVENGS